MAIPGADELGLPFSETGKDEGYFFEGSADSVHVYHHFRTDLAVEIQIQALLLTVTLQHSRELLFELVAKLVGIGNFIQLLQVFRRKPLYEVARTFLLYFLH
jgi:hypothetical protein